MAHRPPKNCRWRIVLAEASLCGLLAFIAPVAAAKPAASDSSADAILLADPGGATPATTGTDLYLEVILNGTDKGLAHFVQRDGGLWATTATLHQLGFVLPPDTPETVRMSSLEGVQVSYDETQQTLAIVAPLKLLNLSTHVLDVRNVQQHQASASPGLLLNYDLYGTWNGQDTGNLSAYTELRAFNGNGVFSSTALAQMIRNAGATHDSMVRLDTSWSTSFPDNMLTLRLGDTLTAATSWSRPTRIGGVQFGTDFALQPYRTTAPLPQFLGSATLPSQVELYVNGLKQYSGDVPAGSFQLNTLPNISGAGQARLVLTNALGQVTTLDFSLYNTQQLLEKGLSDWSAELGVVRESYGLNSFDYGHDPVGSGTWRRGISDTFTAEAHGEATNGLIDAGVGGDWLLGLAGVVSGSVAHSASRGTEGSQLSLGYSWNNNHFDFGFNGIRASSGYRDVATLYGSPPPRLSASANAGVSTDLLGSFGVSYFQLRYPQSPATRYGSVYWFRSVGRRWSLSFSANQNLDQARDRSLFFDVGVSLDNNIYMDAGALQDANGTHFTADASQSVPTEGGFGWRAQWQQDGSSGGNNGRAELDYLGRYGQVQAGMYSFGGSDSGYAGANGSLVWMDGHVFAARPIYDSFAVVSTDGVPNVPVQLANNPIGTTDSQGMLLVTPLNAYQNNQLSINPLDLPADMRIARVDAVATPTDRSGVLVHFGITPIRAASIILVDAAGKPLPLGSTARLRGQPGGEPVLVGFDGEVYLDTLEAHNVLEVDTPTGACHVAFGYHKQGDGIPQIGPLVCKKEKSP